MKVIFKILILFILLGIIYFEYNYYSKNKEVTNNEIKKNDILSHYNDAAVTNKETNIYQLIDGNYVKKGSINSGIYLNLKPSENSNQYFHLKDIDYYVYYQDVDVSEEVLFSNRYKKYVVFNKNVITNDKTIFYDDNNKYVIKTDEELSLPIWIMDNDKYYVEYLGRLLYVKKGNIKEVINNNNTKLKVRTDIRTLAYHQVYNNTIGETCPSAPSICHPITQFEAHMKYLHDNNYLTLTMEELELFLDSKIRIPTKSIVITIDDGGKAYNAVNIAEKYQTNITYFIITGRYNLEKTLIFSNYVNYQSHTDNLHNNYKCPGGNQGGQLLCEKEDVILADLALSQEKLGGKKQVYVFAYPFFDFNERAIKLLKKADFRLAFIGQYGTNGYSYPSTDRYILKRKTIFSYDSLNTFIGYLK